MLRRVFTSETLLARHRLKLSFTEGCADAGSAGSMKTHALLFNGEEDFLQKATLVLRKANLFGDQACEGFCR